jgi:RNA polymerase sigma-70 factor (ECF subfamily)
VFVRAYFALPTHDRSRPLAPWLLTIARNLCFTASRRKRHEVPAAEGEKVLMVARDSTPTPASVVEGHDLRRRIWQAIDSLPDEFRQVILLRHVSELSYEEICQATGLPIGTVKSRLNRGRRLLARELAEER